MWFDAHNNNSHHTDSRVQLEEKVTTKETEKDALQGELDETYLLFADAEEKANKYKARLKDKGESITDDEDGDDDGEEDEEAETSEVD